MKKLILHKWEECWVQLTLNAPSTFGRTRASMGRFQVRGAYHEIANLRVFIYRQPNGWWAICDPRSGVKLQSGISDEAVMQEFENVSRQARTEILREVAREPDVMDLPTISTEEAHEILGVS